MSNVKTVLYFLGGSSSGGSSTSGSATGSGLYRREMDRAVASFSSTQGQSPDDSSNQEPLAAEVTNQAADVGALITMIGVTEGNLDAADIDASPDLVLADAGYCSEANLTWIAETESNVLVATGRIKNGERVPDSPRGRIPQNATQRERMARRLRTTQGRIDYARRKAIVEPAFGQMKVRQSAGQLRLRGLAGAQCEWTLHVICHNLRKLANATQGAPLGAC